MSATCSKCGKKVGCGCKLVKGLCIKCRTIPPSPKTK